MKLAHWLRSLAGSRKAPARSPRPARGPLRLEILEDRALPSGGPGASDITSGGGSGSSGGPAPAIVSTDVTGSGQTLVSPTGSQGSGGPGYPLVPVTGPCMTGSFGSTSGTGPSLPMPLQGSTVAVVPVLVATSGPGPSSGTSGTPTFGAETATGGTLITLNAPAPTPSPTPTTAP